MVFGLNDHVFCVLPCPVTESNCMLSLIRFTRMPCPPPNCQTFSNNLRPSVSLSIASVQSHSTSRASRSLVVPWIMRRKNETHSPLAPSNSATFRVPPLFQTPLALAAPCLHWGTHSICKAPFPPSWWTFFEMQFDITCDVARRQAPFAAGYHAEAPSKPHTHTDIGVVRAHLPRRYSASARERATHWQRSSVTQPEFCQGVTS